jgi:hypothetical protein
MKERKRGRKEREKREREGEKRKRGMASISNTWPRTRGFPFSGPEFSAVDL